MTRPYLGNLHRIHIQILEEDYQWLLERVGPYRIGVVTRSVLHKYIQRKRDEERKELDTNSTSTSELEEEVVI